MILFTFLRFSQLNHNGLFQKKSRGIEERACGNSRGQLKKKWNFQVQMFKKNSCDVKFSWVLVLTLGCHTISTQFPRGVTQFCRISRVKSLFSVGFLRVKWQISQPVGRGSLVQKSISSTPHFDFIWSPVCWHTAPKSKWCKLYWLF